MAENDPDSIPILDDIIATGDADKAALRADNEMQRSLELDQAEQPDSAGAGEDSAFGTDNTEADVTASEVVETQKLFFDDDTVDEAETDEITASTESKPGDELSDYSDTSPELNEAAEQDINITDPAEDTEGLPIAIEALTEDILNNMMPELERLLRDKIRQTLEQQLTSEADETRS